MSDEPKSLVIATENIEKALYIVSKDAMAFDVLELRYGERYAAIVELLLRILRKGFGWLEQDRGMKEVENTKCFHNHFGYCARERKVDVRNPQGAMRCRPTTRLSCKHYRRKFDTKINVNFVVIEKVGQIRNL